MVGGPLRERRKFPSPTGPRTEYFGSMAGRKGWRGAGPPAGVSLQLQSSDDLGEEILSSFSVDAK